MLKHVRTSTVVLMLAFVAVWWVYDTYQPAKPPAAPQVVPPGFVPDPNYTWVPRTRLEQPPVTITATVTPPPATITEEPPTTTLPPPWCPPFICPPAEPATPNEPPPTVTSPSPPTTTPPPAP